MAAPPDDIFIPLPAGMQGGTPILKWILSRPNTHLFPLHLLTSGRSLNVAQEEIVVGYEEAGSAPLVGGLIQGGADYQKNFVVVGDDVIRSANGVGDASCSSGGVVAAGAKEESEEQSSTLPAHLPPVVFLENPQHDAVTTSFSMEMTPSSSGGMMVTSATTTFIGMDGGELRVAASLPPAHTLLFTPVPAAVPQQPPQQRHDELLQTVLQQQQVLAILQQQQLQQQLALPPLQPENLQQPAFVMLQQPHQLQPSHHHQQYVMLPQARQQQLLQPLQQLQPVEMHLVPRQPTLQQSIAALPQQFQLQPEPLRQLQPIELMLQQLQQQSQSQSQNVQQLLAAEMQQTTVIPQLQLQPEPVQPAHSQPVQQQQQPRLPPLKLTLRASPVEEEGGEGGGQRIWKHYVPVLPPSPTPDVTMVDEEDIKQEEDDGVMISVTRSDDDKDIKQEDGGSGDGVIKQEDDDVTEEEDEEDEDEEIVVDSPKKETESPTSRDAAVAAAVHSAAGVGATARKRAPARRMRASKEQRKVFSAIGERVHFLWLPECGPIADAFELTPRQVRNVFINRGGRAAHRKANGMNSEEALRIIEEELTRHGYTHINRAVNKIQ